MTEKISQNLSLAVSLAHAGIPVFPCLEAASHSKDRNGKPKGAKAPYTDTGFKAATTNAEQIARWWTQWPNAVPGIPTGETSGLSVIDGDIDRDTGENIGEDQIENLVLNHPKAVKVRTCSGGVHLIYRHVEGARTSSKQVASRVDTRGAGGYIIAPGSIMTDGSRYSYERRSLAAALREGDLSAFPVEEVNAAIAARKAKQNENDGTEEKTPAVDSIFNTGDWQTRATEDETLDVLRGLLAEAPNRLCREDWVKLAVSLRVGFGQKLRDDFIDFSQRYADGKPCTPQEAAHVWNSSGNPNKITSIAPALSLLKEGVGSDRFNAVYREVFNTTRNQGSTGKQQAATSDGQPTPNAPDKFDLSHDALATALGADSFDRDARYVAAWGKWLFWTGTRWEIDNRLEHLTRTRVYLRNTAAAVQAWAEREATAQDAESNGKGSRLRDSAQNQSRALRSKTTVAAVESLARSNPSSVAGADVFDDNRLLLGTPGGTVDLTTGELRPARREDMITKLTACAPAPPGSKPTRWLSFLDEIFDGDKDLIDFMQRVAGYALTGRTTEHKLLFFYGTGRNGKSVFLNLLTWLWGDYARRAAAETFLSTNGDKHATGVAGLAGARLVAGSELPKGRSWDESLIKDLTGGDRMHARAYGGYVPNRHERHLPCQRVPRYS